MTDPDDFAALRAALEAAPEQRDSWEREGATVYELTQKGRSHVNRWSANVQSAQQSHELTADEKVALATYIAAANPEVIARLLAELDAAKRAEQVHRAERDHARANVDCAVYILTGIHSLLYPPTFQAPGGHMMAFRPKSLDPHEVLQELSDRIRALPEELAAMKDKP